MPTVHPRSRWSRVLPALLLMLAALSAGLTVRPAPAEAAEAYVTPFWVVHCHGCKAIVPRDGKAVRVPFGLISTGRVSGAKLTLDTSGITAAKVGVVGVEGPCTRSGSLVTCDFGTVDKGEHVARLVLQAKSGAPAGAAGTVQLTSSVPSSDPAQEGKVEVSQDPSATDISIKTSATAGKIGGTSTVTYTLRNNGPSVQPWVELTDGRPQSGTTFVRSDKCTQRDGVAACRISNLAVGASAKFALTYKINKCEQTAADQQPGGGFNGLRMGYQDSYSYNETWRFRITVAGCAGGTTGGTTASASPSGGASASPGASAPAVPEAQGGDTTVTILATPASATPADQTTTWPYAVGGALVLALLGLGGLTVVRRRRAADPTPPA